MRLAHAGLGWLGHGQLCGVLVLEVDCVCNLNTVCRFGYILLAPVMLKQYANTPPVFTAEIPVVSCIRFEVCNNLEAKGPKGCGIEVEGASKNS